ncbi:serine/threonine-protein kinase [Streptomyces sp. 6N223]|uniref:serine/threonine-protein kinase n=1 Tax=Streptomyces sp. 6N223 TaxID=3457412 RepID=UPI003FD243B8
MEALYPQDPSAIGPYRLLGRLGEGGMGRVYLGRSPSGRMVAVKVVHGELAREPHFRRRFRAEIESAQRVSGMWTAPVLDHDIDSAVPWVATGYVAGPTLREVVDTLHGPLPENSVWALAYGLAHALIAVHGSGLIHRDLKPSNVMVTLEGPKVIDFGIARSADASVVTRTGGMVGSPGYMPPEQIRGQELTGAADVFAMGAVLAYAATGRSPFSWDGAQTPTVIYRVMNDPPNLGPEDGRLKGDLRTLVLHCLAKGAGDRPGLAGIPALAEKRAGTDYWLPSGLTARLGQVAANLLAFDGPEADRPPSAWGPRPPSSWDPRPSSASSLSRSPASQPTAAGHSHDHGHGHTTQLPGEFKEYELSRTSSPASQGGAPPAAVAPPLPSLPVPPPPAWTPPTGPPTPLAARRWGRRRSALAAASGVLVLAVSSWLVVANVGSGEEPAEAAAPSESADDNAGDAGDGGALNAQQQSLIGDAHTADVCSLTNAEALAEFGQVKEDRDYGNFNQCDASVYPDEETRVDVSTYLTQALPPEGAEPFEKYGGFSVVEAEEKPDDECELTLVPAEADGGGLSVAVRVNLEEGSVAGGRVLLCAIADAAAESAARVLNEGQIPRRSPRENSLAWQNACQLIDADALATAVPGLEDEEPAVGVAGWECEWESDFDELVAEVSFHREQPPMTAGDGIESVEIGGYEAFVEPEEPDDTCTVFLQYREYGGQDSRPAVEMLRVEVEGQHRIERLCEMAQELTTSAAAELRAP